MQRDLVGERLPAFHGSPNCRLEEIFLAEILASIEIKKTVLLRRLEVVTKTTYAPF